MRRLAMIFIMFLFLGAFFIISENNLKVSNKKALKEFGNLYIGWLDKLSVNLHELSGYVVKLDWLPKPEKSFLILLYEDTLCAVS